MSGFAKLVGTEVKKYFEWANNTLEWFGDNPYGNGEVSFFFVDSIINE